MNGIVKDEVLKRARKEFKSTFSPRRFLKGMDITSGSLNLSAIDVMREHIEGTKKHHIGLIPSSSSIQRVASKLAVYADEIIPFVSFETDTGKGIRFDYEKLFNVLLLAYSLKERAKNWSIALSLASDGAKVTNNILQVVAGVKVNDIDARCPLTKNLVSPQTRNICWPMLFVMGQENTKMYDTHIKPLYAWWEEASEANKFGFSKKLPKIKPVKISSTNDMSATWKMIGKGGTAKVKEFFCHCCDCTLNEISHDNPTKCEFCTDFIEQNPVWLDNWKCYHQQIITSKYKDEIKQQYDHLMNELTTSLEEIDKHSEIKIIYHDQTEKIGDPFSINFEPTSVAEASQFQDLLVEESLLRNLDIMEKSRDELRSELKKICFRKNTYANYLQD